MAYETGTATDQQDLMDKLRTFLVTGSGQSWVQDEFDIPNKRVSVHKNSVYVQFRWDSVATTGGIGIFQSLGFTGGGTTLPGNHPDDSGSGLISGSPITSQRRLDRIGNGPFTAYHFFANSVSGRIYAHAALEYANGLYRHMSFGELIKNGVWTGGEYCCGHVWAAGGGVGDSIANQSHNFLIDWRSASSNLEGCTVHVEGMPGEGVSSKWGVVLDSTTLGNDRAGNARVALLGGTRDGFLHSGLSGLRANPNNGFIPMIPLPVYYRRLLSPEQWFKLGTAPGVRFVNGHFINPVESFVVGADTWRCFPFVRKQEIPFGGADSSGNMFIAYRQ